MSERSLSRRNFLKLVGLTAVSTALATCAPKLVEETAPTTPTSDHVFSPTATETPVAIPKLVPKLNPTATETPVPTITASRISVPETPIPDVWKLSLTQRVELIAKPEFFTELQGNNTKKIITLQFDDSEYIGINRKTFHNNACGEATLATIAKMCNFLNTGKVPDITIADVFTLLDGMTFEDIRGYTANIITWDDEMYFVGLADTLKLLMPQLISKTEFLTPNYGARYTRIVPQTNWPKVLSKAQTICEDGGFMVIHCLKYGAGHILLATDVKKDGTATIVDSYSGTAQRVFLKNYFEWWVDPEAKSLGKQPGLLNMIGIIPKLSDSN